MLSQKKLNYAKVDEDTGYSYWLFSNELDRQTCQRIIQLGNDQWEEAKIVNIDGVAEENKNVRGSLISYSDTRIPMLSDFIFNTLGQILYIIVYINQKVVIITQRGFIVKMVLIMVKVDLQEI